MAKVEILALSPGLPRTDLADHSRGPNADARAVVEALFPGRIAGDLPRADLLSAAFPGYGRIYAATFGPTALICGQDLIELVDLGAVTPAVADGRTAIRLQMNGEIGVAALEILAPDGAPAREVMLAESEGVVFDSGPRLSFEEVFWAGRRDPDGAFTRLNGPEMPFDPTDFGEEALRSLFGFVIDAEPQIGDLEAASIELYGFAIRADAADPADLAAKRGSIRSVGLPDQRSGGGAGGRAGGSGAAPVEESGADASPASEPRTWWQRLKRQLFPG